MIERTVKTLTGKLNVKIPSRLDELTMSQMMQLQEKEDLSDLDAISILSGITIDKLKNVVHFSEFDVFGEAVLTLSNEIKYLYNSDAIPETINFNIEDKQVKVKVIRNLSMEPAGAFMASRDIIAEEISNHIKKHGEENWQENFNPSLKACCQVLAQYFYCRATANIYNDYQAEAFTEIIKTLRVTEALPIAKHFFMSYPNLSKPKAGYSHRLRQFWKRKPAYRPSRNLNTSTPSIH
ncbi:hypothetical protein [Mucilaginibacter sp. dw_454]|uniref:hypothetical protein n=1 Tax=Mucilaginibacter sp. dw_454 TaxID=2720079 RepID=UPI001BD5A43E|nr:hypothetical protein [Mucilaginibacter sp. dw_454]